MKRILHGQKNGLSDLHKIPIEALMKFKGVGLEKALKIKAVFEISKRLQSQPFQEKKQFNSSADVFQSLQALLGNLQHEEFWILYLNQVQSAISKKMPQ